MITPEEAYEAKYAHLDKGIHTWSAAPPHSKAAWLDAWFAGVDAEREECALLCEALAGSANQALALSCADKIRERAD